MKLNLMLLFISSMVLLSACKKEEDSCPADDLSSVLVGTWTVSAVGQEIGEVEFKADGTLIDEDDILIAAESNGTILDEKTYTVPSNQLLQVKASKDAQFISADLTVTAFTCDQVNLMVFNIEATLTR